MGLLDESRRPLAPIAFWAAVHGLSTLLLDGPLAALTEPEQAGRDRAHARYPHRWYRHPRLVMTCMS